jgi:hypothetical protein
MKNRFVLVIFLSLLFGCEPSTSELKLDLDDTVDPTGILLDKTELTIIQSQVKEIKASVEPADVTVSTVYWSSSDESIAIVTADGRVAGLKPGKTVIKASTFDNMYSESCTVTVLLMNISTSPIADNIDLTTKIKGVSAIAAGTIATADSITVKIRGVCWNTNGNPTIEDDIAQDGAGDGYFKNAELTGLKENTEYYVKAYATLESGETFYGNEVLFNSGYAFDGTLRFGGYVFYNNGKSGGFVCTPGDLSTGESWSDVENNVVGTGTGIGDGISNTHLIINQSGHTSGAASTCNSHDDGTYNDWFLPSKDELLLIYENVHNLGYGSFAANDSYNSSSESNAVNRWKFNFESGVSETYNKTFDSRTCGARKF